MQIQKCTMMDVPKLALLNKQLIEDEKSDNLMNINELESRMKGFLETDYSAYFFIEDSQTLDMHSLEILVIRYIYDSFL